MIGTFNKHDFEKKLHYTMLMLLASFNGLCEFNDSKDVTETINFFWSNALRTLWQTRLEGVVMIGIDKPSEFESFCALIQIGINQMNANINELVANKNVPAQIRMSQIQVEMKEKAAALTDDVVNLLNHTINATA